MKDKINKNEEDKIYDPQEEEYEKYRNSLIFYRECAACHYVQGMVLLGLGFFSAVRLQFLWSSIKIKSVIGYSLFTLIASTLGVYKISYAYHVFQAQGEMIKHNKNI